MQSQGVGESTHDKNVTKIDESCGCIGLLSKDLDFGTGQGLSSLSQEFILEMKHFFCVCSCRSCLLAAS